MMRSKSKYLYNYYNIKKYNDSYYRLTVFKVRIKNPGFEIESKYKSEKNNIESEGKLDKSIIRARSKVFEYALCNDFDYFVTLTLDKNKVDRYNLDDFIKRLGQFIRDYRKKYGVNIQYLLIPERHKNNAWHMHGLIKGIPKEHLSINKNGFKDWEAYAKKFGYISIDEIKNKEAVSKYITKYISKSFDGGGGVTEKNKKMYYCSRGLKKAEKIKEGTYYSSYNDNFDYENEYIKVKTVRNLEEISHLI